MARARTRALAADGVLWVCGTVGAWPILLRSMVFLMICFAWRSPRIWRHLATAAGVRMPRMHPHMLRHTYVTTMLDAGVRLRDVQIAARHADPKTTMRYDRARKNLDRHPTTSSNALLDLPYATVRDLRAIANYDCWRPSAGTASSSTGRGRRHFKDLGHNLPLFASWRARDGLLKPPHHSFPSLDVRIRSVLNRLLLRTESFVNLHDHE